LSATILSAVALLLALGDTVLVLTNRSARRQTDEQRQFLQQTAQFNGVNENLVRQIARAAVEDKDQALRDLLVSHGIKIQTEPAASQPPAPPEKK
jgi:DNA-binding sugar fermentation-stimulating protein